MKPTRLSLVAALLLTAHTLVAGSLAVQLRALPEKTLPGLPFDLRAELTNTTDHELNLANLASLTVREANGAEFVAACGSNRRCAFPQFNSTSFTLAPHETVSISLLDWPVPLSATWLDDPRLHRVGTYELELVFNGPAGGTSNAAKLVVEEPSGADAAVFGQLRAAAGDAPVSADLFRNATPSLQAQLQHDYPQSRYAPYLTAARLDPVKPADLAGFLHDQPDYAFAEMLQLRIAEWHLNNAQAALHLRDRADLAATKRELTQAQSQYQTLSRSTTPYVSETAKMILDFIAGRDDLNGLLDKPEKKRRP